jgi:hypothetical protein
VLVLVIVNKLALDSVMATSQHAAGHLCNKRQLKRATQAEVYLIPWGLGDLDLGLGAIATQHVAVLGHCRASAGKVASFLQDEQ